MGDSNETSKIIAINNKLKSTQNLLTGAIILAPISLIFGGVLLSTIAVICAALAFRKCRTVQVSDISDPAISNVASNLMSQSKWILIISIVVLGLNLYTFAMSAIAIIEILQSGNAEQIQALMNGDLSVLNDALAQVEDSNSDSKSIWD